MRTGRLLEDTQLIKVFEERIDYIKSLKPARKSSNPKILESVGESNFIIDIVNDSARLKKCVRSGRSLLDFDRGFRSRKVIRKR